MSYGTANAVIFIILLSKPCNNETKYRKCCLLGGHSDLHCFKQQLNIAVVIESVPASTLRGSWLADTAAADAKRCPETWRTPAKTWQKQHTEPSIPLFWLVLLLKPKV